MDTALDTLLRLVDVLGFDEKPEDSLPEDIQKLVMSASKRATKLGPSDSLREQIKEKGYLVEDTKSGQKVTKA